MTYDTSKTVQIPLTKGYVAVVDECDADLNQYKWHSHASGNNQYAVRSLPTGKQFLHRVIVERVIERQLTDKEFVDHKDGNPLNDVRDNLRICTHIENMRNSKKRKGNLTGYKGVSYRKDNRNWRAVIWVNGKKINLGTFTNPEAAYKAYCEAAIKYHGEFARLE